MGKTIHSEARNMIIKVNQFFEMEKANGMFCIPVDQTVKRTCAATGVAKKTLMTIKRQARQLSEASTSNNSFYNNTQIKLPTPGKKRKKYRRKIEVDDFDICAIRNIVTDFYIKKENPSLKKILAVAKRDLNFKGGRTFLRSILIHKLGYKFKKCTRGRTVLYQRPNIAECRARYLRRITQNNDLGELKKPVTFLIHSHYTVQNNTDNNAKKKNCPGPQWIIIHAGGENGFVPGAELLYKSKNTTGDYLQEMDTNNFMKWLKENLIPNLPRNSIVVLDNTPYNSKESVKAPSSTTRLCDMQDWLRENNIPFNENLSRRELYPIILRNKSPKKYVVDDLLKEHGHEVLRLPPNHCDLNPVEYVWRLVKQKVADNDNQCEKDIEELIREAISSITQSDWKKKVYHVEGLQQDYWEKDDIEDENVRQLITDLGGEDSSEHSTDSEVNGSDSNESDNESEEEPMLGIEPIVEVHYVSSSE